MNVIDKIQLENGETRNISIPPDLTDEQKATIRQNIGAVEENGTYNDMTVGNATNAQNAENSENDGNGENIAQALQNIREDIPLAGTVVPEMAGVAAVGTSEKYAHEDHIHPTDTTRAAQSDLPIFSQVTIPSGAWIVGNTAYFTVSGVRGTDLVQFIPSDESAALVIENDVRLDRVTVREQVVFKCGKTFTGDITGTIIAIHTT